MHFDIGIITYFFPPDNNPRAFRAYELAREFGKQGLKTAVIIPDFNRQDKEDPYYSLIKVRPGYKKNILSNSSTGSISQINVNRKQVRTSSIKKKYKSFKDYIVTLLYPGAFSFEYSKSCPEDLLKKGYQFDHILSIALPICTHAAARNFKNISGCKTLIGDYGDPYSYNQSIKPPKIHRFWERNLLKSFDFISIPDEIAVGSYLPLIERRKIAIIPQGINIEEYLPNNTKPKSKEIRFMFAGVFYTKIRHPKDLIQFLQNSTANYCFTILTKTNDPETKSILDFIQKELPPDKVIIKDLIPRKEAIQLMAEQDFLINIDNTSTNQIPSKLIDYKISGKPVFSYKPGEFSGDTFSAFINGNYTNDAVKQLDLQKYHITTIVRQYLALFNK